MRKKPYNSIHCSAVMTCNGVFVFRAWIPLQNHRLFLKLQKMLALNTITLKEREAYTQFKEKKATCFGKVITETAGFHEWKPNPATAESCVISFQKLPFWRRPNPLRGVEAIVHAPEDQPRLFLGRLCMLSGNWSASSQISLQKVLRSLQCRKIPMRQVIPILKTKCSFHLKAE